MQIAAKMFNKLKNYLVHRSSIDFNILRALCVFVVFMKAIKTDYTAECYNGMIQISTVPVDKRLKNNTLDPEFPGLLSLDEQDPTRTTATTSIYEN
jgi:hypothetical protein